jgi:iron-sulfur cluster assembly protein
MFRMTPGALQEIQAAAERSDADGMALRVAARKLDDGSIEYGMGFDEERVDDQPADFQGLTVLVGASSRALLERTVLDYAEVEPGHFAFVFVPEREASAGGCGSSAPASRGGCGSSSCGSCGG